MGCPQSVSVVVLNADNAVLLHKREDFRIWTLPGGFLNPGETWEQAAIREAHEETGYHIAVERFVGEYSQPQMPNGGELKFVCTGRVIGGEAIQRGAETVKVGWFDARRLPFSLTRFMRAYIEDALAGHPAPLAGGRHRRATEAAEPPQPAVEAGEALTALAAEVGKQDRHQPEQSAPADSPRDRR